MPRRLLIAERLLAHAKLYRHMAEQTWSEELAARLQRKAEDCVKAAGLSAPDISADRARQER